MFSKLNVKFIICIFIMHCIMLINACCLLANLEFARKNIIIIHDILNHLRHMHLSIYQIVLQFNNELSALKTQQNTLKKVSAVTDLFHIGTQSYCQIRWGLTMLFHIENIKQHIFILLHN